MISDIKWNERYNIGVEVIDKAHRKLFSIVRKMVMLNNDEKDREWICREGIKYFKNYVLKHFAEEEAYMRSVNYSGYAAHKCVHDDMKNETLPALEKEMDESDYSSESIQHFLGICTGWLSHHILLEDRAITGQIPNKWTEEWTEDTSILEKTILWAMKQLFNLELTTVSSHYGGEDFGKKICYRLTYRESDNASLKVYFVLEEKLVLEITSQLLHIPLTRVDRTVTETLKIFARHFMKRIAGNHNTLNQYRLESDHLLSEEQLEQDFDKKYPNHSLLFNTGIGYFALCVKSQ